MILLDTTILAYALGRDHPLRDPARRLIEAISARSLEATTTPEVIQEFLHVHARRRSRTDAAALARRYSDLLSPLATVDADDLERGLVLFTDHPELGAFDAVLAATAIGRDATALVSADSDFGVVPGLRHVAPGTPAFEELLGRA